MKKISVKLKDSFYKDFLVTLKGNQFIKGEITEVDTEDKEVQGYLLKYSNFIEIFEFSNKAIEEPKEEVIEEPKKEPKEEVNLDLNNDGIINTKDASIAGKVMNEVKKNKKKNKTKK